MKFFELDESTGLYRWNPAVALALFGAITIIAIVGFIVVRRRNNRDLDEAAGNIRKLVEEPVEKLAQSTVGMGESLCGLIDNMLAAMKNGLAIAICWQNTIPLIAAGKFAEAVEAIVSDKDFGGNDLNKHIIRAIYRAAVANGSAESAIISAKHPFVLEAGKPLAMPEFPPKMTEAGSGSRAKDVSV